MRFQLNILFLALLLGLTGQVVAAIPTTERNQLIALYNTTNGASWTNKTGWLGAAGSECSWTGITCDPKQVAVVGINLSNNNLVGPLPSSFPSGLTSLNLSQNQLTGVLPTTLSTLLPALTTLDLSNNQLTGSIPNSLPSSLTTLKLSHNQLSGAIPSYPNFLPARLQDLRLDFNQLTGPVPFDLPSTLVTVILGNNLLTGALPSTLPNSLEYLVLNHNQLSGSIPTGLSNVLPALTFLDLGNNQFTGSFPSGLPSTLQDLRIYNNQLTGTLPLFLSRSLPALTILVANSNQFTGAIPSNLPTRLQQLILFNNALSGAIPTSLPSSLSVLLLDQNQLTGTIPTSFSTALPALTELYLGSNLLTGTIPTNLPSRLLKLSLHSNQLTGAIPNSLPSSLTYLDLHNNQLSAGIPTSLPTGLQDLILNNNTLTGPLPALLPLSLKTLTANNNQLNGSIPTSLPANLLTLNLDNNQIAGSIPSNLPTGLTQITLNNNLLTGNIPSALPTSLTLLALNNNQLSGAIPPALAQISTLTTLALQANNCLFTGDSALKTYLNAHTQNWQTQNNCVAPVAAFTFVQSSNFAPATINLDASSSTDSYAGIESYSWLSSDGQSATGKQVSLTFTKVGDYSIALTVQNGNTSNNSAVASKTVTVAAPANPVASFTSNVSQGTTPLAVAFDASASSNASEFVWSSSDGQTANGKQVSLTFNTPGTITVTLTVSNSAGVKASTSKTITVNPKVSPTFRLTTNGSTQAPLTINLDASSLNITDTKTVYAWRAQLQSAQPKALLQPKANTYLASGKVTSLTLTEPGTYLITLTATDSAGTVYNAEQSLVVTGLSRSPSAGPRIASGSFVEPNDTEQQATPILINDTPLIHLLTTNNVDWYEFLTKKGLNYTIEIPVESIGKAINPAIQIFDNNGSPITELLTQTTTAKGISVTIKATSSGIYRIRVTGMPPLARSADAGDSTYSIRVFLTDAPQRGLVKGKVLEACNQNGINNAEVSAVLNNLVSDSTLSFKTGEFGLLLNPATYQINSSASNFIGYGLSTEVVQTSESNLDFYLAPVSTCQNQAAPGPDLVKQEQDAVAVYNSATGLLIVRDALAGGSVYYAELQNTQDYRFQLLKAIVIPGAIHAEPATYNYDTLLADLPTVFALGRTWKVQLRYSNGLFGLEHYE